MSLANRFNPYQWYVWLQRKGEYFNKINFQCKMQENLPVLHSLYMCQRVYSFTSSAGKSSAMMIWPFTQNRSHLFLYEWTTTKGTIYVNLRSERCVLLSLSFRFFFVSMFVCIFVCLFGFFLLVYLIVFLICLVSWLFVFFFIRLPMFFVCLFFFLVFNVFLCLRPCECIFFFRPILS